MLSYIVIAWLSVGHFVHIDATGIEKAQRACDSYPTISRLRQLTDLIINGEQAADNEFPFNAFLGYPVEYEGKTFYEGQCSGALISDKYVLTAAHCIAQVNNMPEIARFGSNWANATKDDTGVQEAKIKNTIKHPNYSSRGTSNDIGLIELETTVKLTKYVSPICLQTKTSDVSGETLTTQGWGLTEPLGSNSQQLYLLKVQLRTMKNSDCNESLARAVNKKFKGILPSMICSQGKAGEKLFGGSCNGDAGNALHMVENDKYHLVGINSFGLLCGSSSPEVATRVSSYIDWIASIVYGNEIFFTGKH